jgi:ankyrin repeat protein
MLISHGADLEAKDGNMMTALHHACEEGHLDAINILLDNRAAIEAPGQDRKTPLICAAEAGRSQAVKLLLKRKATSRGLDETGMTALHWAAYNGHEEIVRILSEKKGSLDAVNNMGRTALHLATIQSQFAVVDCLQRKGMQLDKRCNTGLTALHYACMADSFEITRLLLMTGADVEASESQHQQRPLHIAAARGSVPILELLCERGAALDARNGVGDRPACVASRFGHVGAVQKLLDRGSPVCLKFETGFREDSLLCLAALGGHWAVASLLLARGASIVKKDETGWTPVRYAAHYGHTSILQLFLSSNKIPHANLPEIIQLPQTIGFAPVVSTEKKVEVQQLLGQFSKYPAPAPAPASTQGPIPGPISVQGPVPRPPPALITEPAPSRREQAGISMSTAYASPAPFASEAGSTAIYELPGSLDRGPEPAEGNHSTPSEHLQGNMNSVEPTTAIVGQRVLTPEMRHPEPTQAVAGGRIAALLHSADGLSTSAPKGSSTSASASTSTSVSGPSQSRDHEAPRVSATYTPVSFIYSPTPSPPVRSYAIPHRGRNSVLITPPLAEQSAEAARVPRSIPPYEDTVPRIESTTREEEQGGDSDSDSDSISSVYTAPEGDENADVSISNTAQEISVQKRS